MVGCLLSIGASPYDVSLEYPQPLSMARNDAMRDVFLARGVLPGAQSYGSRWNALTAALMTHDADTVRYYLAHGVDPSAPWGGWPALLMLAGGVGKLEPLEIPRDDAWGPTPTRALVTDRTIELVEILVKAGGDLSARTADGQSMLDLAWQTNNGPLVSYLIDHGSRPDE